MTGTDQDKALGMRPGAIAKEILYVGVWSLESGWGLVPDLR